MFALSHSNPWKSTVSRIFLVIALTAVLFAPGLFTPAAAVKADATTPAFVYQTTNNAAPFDYGHEEVVDGAGNAYILEYAYDSNNDVAVVKLSPTGVVQFVTHLSGSALDYGSGLALDGSGGLWVVGWTDSSDFPLVNAAQPVKDNNRSAFLTRLSTSDGSILYSSYFGANRADEFHDITVNSAGELYLVGKTDSTNFPVVNPIQAGLNLTNCFCDDAFVLKLTADANTVLYSTYLGGWNDDQGDKIGLDSSGNIYVAGITKSSDFPLVGAFQPIWGGEFDAWAARISADGSQLEYSTYLGGARSEYLWGDAIAADGTVTLAGATNSSGFPVSSGAYQTTFGGGLCGAAGFGQFPCNDGFITRLAPDGSLVYSTFLGGSNNDDARNVAVDSVGNAYIAGYASSTDFPPAGLSASSVIFVYSLDASGSALRFDLTVPSATSNAGHGIALGPNDDIFFSGSINAPSDLYAARLSQGGGTTPTDTPTPTPTPTDTPTPTPTPSDTPTPTPTPTQPAGLSLHVGDIDGISIAISGRQWRAGVQITVHDGNHTALSNVTVSGDWSGGASGSASCVTNGSGICTIISGKIRNAGSATFSVTDLSLSGYTYTGSANHDPESDSTGTVITINQP